MHIIVPIKQVPDPESGAATIDPETGTLRREGASIVNPFDMNAIEEALRIKERIPDVTTTVITMGPPQADKALRLALAMGIDNAYLICDAAFAGSDTWATGYSLSSAIRYIGNFDLVICGKQAIDGDTAQVGPGIAAMLGIPHISSVRKIEEIGNDKIVVERLMEDGYDVLSMDIPCLITVVKEINEPRLESLKGKLRAKKAEIPTLKADDLNLSRDDIGQNGSPTKVIRIFTPPKREGGEILKGEVEEVVPALAQKLLELKIF
ncbi:MAG: electron transfer flavoprotein subunit beta/FixA family protein [Candidatus Coatesbacteria bacterium]|nr:electron transfer flavoprotein subunit beta/FixA family protein [Candidatus Coatesbacteria bacterium]